MGIRRTFCANGSPVPPAEVLMLQYGIEPDLAAQWTKEGIPAERIVEILQEPWMIRDEVARLFKSSSRSLHLWDVALLPYVWGPPRQQRYYPEGAVLAWFGGSMPDPSRLLNAQGLATMIGVSPRSARRIVNAGKISGFRTPGGEYLVCYYDTARYLTKRQEEFGY